MAERPEDLNLPNAVVTRIIKEVLPSGVNVGKDARLAISKAASVFVLYATSCANNNALKSKRKTITVGDIYSALDDMEFGTFVDPLQSQLAAYKTAQLSKKNKKTGGRPSKSVLKTVESEATADDEVVDETPWVDPAEDVGMDTS